MPKIHDSLRAPAVVHAAPPEECWIALQAEEFWGMHPYLPNEEDEEQGMTMLRSTRQSGNRWKQCWWGSSM